MRYYWYIHKTLTWVGLIHGSTAVPTNGTATLPHDLQYLGNGASKGNLKSKHNNLINLNNYQPVIKNILLTFWMHISLDETDWWCDAQGQRRNWSNRSSTVDAWTNTAARKSKQHINAPTIIAHTDTASLPFPLIKQTMSRMAIQARNLEFQVGLLSWIHLQNFMRLEGGRKPLK